MAGESKLSAIEALIVGFTAATMFVLGYGYWQLTTRLDEQDARLEIQIHRSEAAVVQLERTLGRLEEMARTFDGRQHVAVPPPIQVSDDAPSAVAESNGWLVLLATVPGSDLDEATHLADAKLAEANEMGIASGVTIYRTRLMHRFVIGLGAPSGKRAAYALAAVARRRNLAADAYAEHVDQWEAVGNAPFHAQRIQGPVSANRIVE